MPRCWHCKAESSGEHYDRVVYGKGPLFGPWEGWRLAGRYLVGPAGNRITPERLRGILWAEQHRIRKENAASDPKRDSVTLPARELFGGQA